MNRALFTLIFLFITFCFQAMAQGSGSKLQLSDQLTAKNIIVSYDKYDTGGNTSIAFDMNNSYKWSGESPYQASGWGYFDQNGQEIPYIKRDRDLGQTFKIKASAPQRLKSITVRLGFGTNVVRPDMYGRSVSLQLYEVSGTPVLNNNGSDEKMEAYHGFPHDRPGQEIPHHRDDFVSGEIYTTLAIIRNFTFPNKKAFGFSKKDAIPPDHAKLKGKFIKFELPHDVNITLQPEKQYAFLIMIDQPGDDFGFTLANQYTGSYEDGHAIRRDGNGIFPPAPANPTKAFDDPENQAALEAAHFPLDFKARTSIAPSTNGYPDVDTWRDLVFYIETK